MQILDQKLSDDLFIMASIQINNLDLEKNEFISEKDKIKDRRNVV